MYDIQGSNDLELDINGDLILEQTPGGLFRKAVITPKGYIAIEFKTGSYIDENYGNAVYYKIRENINNSLLANISSDVKDATSFVNIPITNVEASLDSLSTINYLITYTDNTQQRININV